MDSGFQDVRRRAVVAGAIAACGRAAGDAPSIVHVCQACTGLMAASAVCASMTAVPGVYEPVGTNGPQAMAPAELQATVGQGPGVEAMAGDRPVLITDLDTAAVQVRWPLFSPPAVAYGMVAVFAFPLLVGTIAVGALEIYWEKAPDTAAAAADGLLFAQAALTMLVSRPGPGDPGPGGPGPDESGSRGPECDGLGPDGPELPEWPQWPERWPEVHQAAGMVSAQMAVGMDEAYVQLRGYAYGHGLSLRDAARRIVDRTLSFRPEPRP